MKKARTKRSKFSLFLILAGVLVILATFAWEAYRYPWATVFGGISQNDSTLPDPPPIVWENGDREAVTSGSSSSSPASAPAILPGNEVPASGGPAQFVELGIIKIPKLNLSQHVLEGTQAQMHYGVGHVTGTAPVGGNGNCALAGHNTTSFRYLNKLAVGDRVILKADGKIFTYSVFNSFTVLPTDTYVLKNIPGEKATLTMITCTPYLTATHRLIVRARLIDGDAPSAGTASGSVGYAPSNTSTESDKS